MIITNVGYNHYHDADFFIHRPEGSGDYLMLLIKTPGIFSIGGEDIRTEGNSALLYKKGTPQFYKAAASQFGNGLVSFFA